MVGMKQVFERINIMTTSEVLKMCTTVDQIEGLMCRDCSNSGHWGWCDRESLICEYRDRIKEILGIPKNKYRINSIEN